MQGFFRFLSSIRVGRGGRPIDRIALQPVQQLADDELIRLAQAGDEPAFRELMTRYRGYVFRAVLPVVGDSRLAEDVVQETFVKLYFTLPQYRHQGWKTWLTRIAVNQAIDHRRKRERLREEPLESAGAVPGGTAGGGASASRPDGAPEESRRHSIPAGGDRPVEEAVLERWQAQRLRDRLDELPEIYRSVVYAYYIREQSYQQIAESRQVAVKTVESQLYRAKQWMRQHWKEEEFR